jgi:hypothetical protein
MQRHVLHNARRTIIVIIRHAFLLIFIAIAGSIYNLLADYNPTSRITFSKSCTRLFHLLGAIRILRLARASTLLCAHYF